jgi:DNA-binding NarL/FixJ family response regulator
MTYRVVSVHDVEASTPAEAAFLAYRKEKRMSAAEAVYEVAVENGGDYQTVRIADAAPMERLSDREQEVARLIMQGAANKDIANTLGITERTVKAHIGHAFEKLGVSNRIELATLLLRQEARCM